MSGKFRPMLAEETPENLMLLESMGFFPMYGSYKVDGIRAVNRDGVLTSRSLKPIRSAFANETFGGDAHNFADGELLVQKKPYNGIYNETYSAVMTFGDMTPLDWHIFDITHEKDMPYRERYELLQDLHQSGQFHPNVKLLEQRKLESVAEVLAMEQEALDAGWEGLIVRRMNGHYKYNRSTLKEGLLIKVARRLTSEAIVEDIEELMHNDNEATVDPRGFQVRSQHQENLRPSGMMGALWVRDVDTQVLFKIGIALEGLWPHDVRKEIWENFDKKYRGRIAKYDYKPYGTMEAPRQPRFCGWRDPDDMGEPDDAA